MLIVESHSIQRKIMRFISFIFIFLLPSLTTAQVKVNPPTGWIELKKPSELPPEIIYVKKVASEDQSIQVSVVAMNPVGSVSDIEEVVAGQISGMKKGGFVLESIVDVEVDGFPAKHIVGEFRSDQYEGAYLADTKLVFSDQATVSISVSIDDARGGRELGDSIIDWITISGSPVTLGKALPTVATSRSIAEKIGYYGFWVVVGAAAVGAVRRRIQRRKSNKSEQR